MAVQTTNQTAEQKEARQAISGVRNGLAELLDSQPAQAREDQKGTVLIRQDENGIFSIASIPDSQKPTSEVAIFVDLYSVSRTSGGFKNLSAMRTEDCKGIHELLEQVEELMDRFSSATVPSDDTSSLADLSAPETIDLATLVPNALERVKEVLAKYPDGGGGISQADKENVGRIPGQITLLEDNLGGGDHDNSFFNRIIKIAPPDKTEYWGANGQEVKDPALAISTLHEWLDRIEQFHRDQ